MKLAAFASQQPQSARSPICCLLSAEIWREIRSARAGDEPTPWRIIAMWLTQDQGIKREAKGLQQALARHVAEKHPDPS